MGLMVSLVLITKLLVTQLIDNVLDLILNRKDCVFDMLLSPVYPWISKYICMVALGCSNRSNSVLYNSVKWAPNL